MWKAGAAMMLDGVEGAIGSAKKLFRRIAVLGKRRDSRTDRQRRALRLSGKPLADSRDHARGDDFAGFRQYQCELVAPVARGRVNHSLIISQNLSFSHPPT